ncbi:MAG: hypothetical protein ACRDDY_01915 [Clostridium sp.]|uniref:hypothetical protein n=1 Tax=Clostridium sp. TaxID=1506 RepID=UPI003EE510DA
MTQKINEEIRYDTVEYDYGYDGGFKIYKRTMYRKRIKQESLTFKVHTSREGKKLTYTYSDGELEYLNRYEKDFFNEFDIKDFKSFRRNLEIICDRERIFPNYGDLMDEFVNETNLKSKFKFFNYLFTSKLFEIIVSEGFGYLIDQNTILTLQTIETTLCKDEDADTLEKAWGIDKSALKLLKENKIKLDKILNTKSFLEKRGFYAFERLFLQAEINIGYIKLIEEFLNSEYEPYELASYVERINKNENIEKDTIILFIADIKKISELLRMKFNPYMDGLRWYHDKMIEMYRIKKREENEKILEESSRHLKVKQVEYKYNCKILKTLSEEKFFDEEDWILGYVEKMKKEKISILHIVNRKNEKDVALMVLKEMKIIDFKLFTSIRKRKEIGKYVADLSKRNNWQAKEVLEKILET